MPQVSIIVSVFNREKTIANTLATILNQEFEDWECLIVDDRSGDQTLRVLNEWEKSDSRFRIVAKPKHSPQGPAASRNTGFKAARGKYVIFFDSDDLMERRFLSTVVRTLNESPQADLALVGFEEVIFRNGVELARSQKIPTFKHDTAFEELVLKKQPIQTAFGTWRKSYLDMLPYIFDESLFKPEDFELYGRAFASGARFVLVSKCLYILLQSEDGIMAEFNKGNPKMFSDHVRARRIALKHAKTYNRLNPVLREYFIDFSLIHFKKSLRKHNGHAALQSLRLFFESVLSRCQAANCVA
jgi:glycosyltransferase involved in cell wall biosynthesis